MGRRAKGGTGIQSFATELGNTSSDPIIDKNRMLPERQSREHPKLERVNPGKEQPPHQPHQNPKLASLR
jgi:hypothetical protein